MRTGSVVGQIIEPAWVDPYLFPRNCYTPSDPTLHTFYTQRLRQTTASRDTRPDQFRYK